LKLEPLNGTVGQVHPKGIRTDAQPIWRRSEGIPREGNEPIGRHSEPGPPDHSERPPGRHSREGSRGTSQRTSRKHLADIGSTKGGRGAQVDTKAKQRARTLLHICAKAAAYSLFQRAEDELLDDEAYQGDGGHD